jgi:hypothetical protein
VIELNATLSQQAGFATPTRTPMAMSMPVSGSGLVAAVRPLPMNVVAGAAVCAAGSKRRADDTTPVWGYRHITDVAVRTGAFPGTSAWSPPM